MHWIARNWCLTGAGIFSLPPCQIGSGTHTAPYQMENGCSFSGKLTCNQISSADIYNMWICILLQPLHLHNVVLKILGWNQLCFVLYLSILILLRTYLVYIFIQYTILWMSKLIQRGYIVYVMCHANMSHNKDALSLWEQWQWLGDT